ncbi:ATP-binding cassette subfamily F protein 3 [Caldalkalibacillus uzonensis]|uniref:ATP-binding cassette subfamily F protein 3 n=1 Tax=Caldalkalibacillus uzonensis TaxID=353224 RepID=A0ABU0CVJ6_9BACI|nr:ABC-F family ATP-binding cassette domain-containing protein [Caldalkalibacillus uzonensis]MDQ0340438.1 ATP-binding cassette subfamily F protein 3 [Caldalkalibacillus uzonensis]
MRILGTHRLTKTYAGIPILTDVTIDIQAKDRIGLVGPNGAGKSTLLKILIGETSYDSGEIYHPKDVTVGYLAQNAGLVSSRSIWQEMLSVFQHLIDEERRLRHMEQLMSQGEVYQDQERYQQLLEEYSRAQDAFKAQGGYEYEAKIRNVLHGLRFAHKDYTAPVSVLSGGEKTRLALAKLLLQEPDLIMLDEPTNYLDLDTLSWLENYLSAYPGAILIVSHDRYFLDRLATVIYELDHTKITCYQGNYSAFIQQKSARLEQQLKQYRRQQQEIARAEEFIQRNIARASTSKRAQSKRKMLEKMEVVERPRTEHKTALFRFEAGRPSGYDVLKVEGLKLGYDQHHVLAQNISFSVFRADRIAVVGPNGIGKTTLLKTITGQLPRLSGTIQIGAHVKFGYFDQEHDKLHPHKTVLAEVWDDYPHLQEQEVRSLLGQFLFSGEDVNKTVSALSGGERARLALAKLMLEQANTLILDEPTNHLDIYAKEVLEEALEAFPGTIIFVSHDRYFLNRLATKVIRLTARGAEMYLGNYDYYLEKRKEQAEIEALGQQKALEQSTKPEQHNYELEKARQRELRKLKRRKEQLEGEIKQTEEMIKTLEEQLYSPDVYQDYEQAQEVQRHIDAARQTLDQLLEEWAELEEQLH